MSEEYTPLLNDFIKEKKANYDLIKLLPLIFAFSFSQQEILPSTIDTIRRISCYIKLRSVFVVDPFECQTDDIQKFSASVVAIYGVINSFMS